MNNGSRRALTGSIHKIREFELEKVCLVEEFDILQIVGEGWFGKILLVEHRASDTEIVLKALPKPYVSIRDFYREFHYGLHLSAHRNIVTTFDVAFETAGFYVFCQEYAPLDLAVLRFTQFVLDVCQKTMNNTSKDFNNIMRVSTADKILDNTCFSFIAGDLTSNMLDTGIGEIHTKRVAKQLSAALEHLHQRDLVHRDVKLDNILIFKSDFSRIKLCDFGETRKVNSAVRRRNEWLPYSPPEVLKLSMDNSYKALINHDIWQFGVVIFICLTGCLPWQKAAFDDPRYTSYYNWYNSSNPLKRQPKLWKMVSSKAQKMFKKFIEPRDEKRATNFIDLSRYIDDRWLAKGYTDRVAGEDIDELCPSMYSFHSDPNEKDILLKHFKDNGIETTVDRQAKKQRIRDWIQNSVIEEVDEEEENVNTYENSDEELEHRTRDHPIDDSHRVTLRYDTEKHINPRTGEVVDGTKHCQQDTKPLSYDVQNIEPVAPANVVRKYGIKEEISSRSSTKDSAYGSMEVKGNTPVRSNHKSEYKSINSVDSLQNNSPSRSLSATSINQNRSPMTSHAERFQRSEEVYSKEIESLKGSTSTLHSLANSSKSNNLQITRNDSNDSSSILNAQSPSKPEAHNSSRPSNPAPAQNGLSSTLKTAAIANKAYTSMKSTPYDNMTARSDRGSIPDTNGLKSRNNMPDRDSPYTSMLNIVQGQMKINPHASETNRNTINVSVSSINCDNKT